MPFTQRWWPMYFGPYRILYDRYSEATGETDPLAVYSHIRWAVRPYKTRPHPRVPWTFVAQPTEKPDAKAQADFALLRDMAYRVTVDRARNQRGGWKVTITSRI